MAIILFLALLTLGASLPLELVGAGDDDDGGDPSYDHQKVTYKSQFEPIDPSATGLTAMPYFSPDHSIDTQVYLLGNATESIDISIPGWDMWGSCQNYSNTCTGCVPSATRADTFPIFAVLLNALHRGISVRILTNDFNTVDCSDMISPLPFLVLNGADVRAYTTTTFDHQKYMNVDGKRVSISSINFSKTSFMYNREAGVVFDGETSTIAEFTTSVFESDWNQGYAMGPSQTYSASDMAIILDKTTLPVVIPPPAYLNGAYVTAAPEPIKLASSDAVKVYTSPDYARTVVLDDISSATKSFEIMIYQITDPTLCASIETLYKKGIYVTVLVSQCIYAAGDAAIAQQCYQNLTKAGFPYLYKTPDYYSMSHQKFWIVDDKKVSWSTGNWSPSDYPTGYTFPPHSESGWQDTNRDFTASIEDANVVAIFKNVLTQDQSRGTKYSSEPKLSCSWE